MSCDPNDNGCIVRECSGDHGRISGSNLFNIWENVYNCPQAYSNKINTSQNVLNYNKENQASAQEDVNLLFINYQTTNTITDDVTSPEYSTFQETLLDLCIDPALPGICGKYLNDYCASFTREQVQNSPTLIEFCGCYTDPNQNYLKYTKDPSCDPLCHRSTTSQKANDNTGEILICPENVCVINDVVINTINTDVANGINFTSVCGGCAGTSGPTGVTGPGCFCVVSADINGSVAQTMGSIGISINFDQFCGGNSVCLTEDQEGNIVSENSCQNINFNDAAELNVKNYIPPPIFIIFVAFFILIVWLLMYIAQNSSDVEYNITQ